MFNLSLQAYIEELRLTQMFCDDIRQWEELEEQINILTHRTEEDCNLVCL